MTITALISLLIGVFVVGVLAGFVVAVRWLVRTASVERPRRLRWRIGAPAAPDERVRESSVV